MKKFIFTLLFLLITSIAYADSYSTTEVRCIGGFTFIILKVKDGSVYRGVALVQVIGKDGLPQLCNAQK